MPGVPQVIAREYSKGARLYYAREAAPTIFARLAGVVGLSGPALQREGKVDVSELDPAPDSLPGGDTEEDYFWKGYGPASKDPQPLTATLNLNQTAYALLITMFQKDEIALWELRFRSGAKLSWAGFVDAIPLELEDNQLAKVPVQVQPTGRVTYTAAP